MTEKNSASLTLAQKIMDHLEGREAPNRGISGAIGRMQRREYGEVKQEIANLIEGKPAVEERAAAADTRQGNLPATGNGGAGNEGGKSPGKPSSGKAAGATA